MAICPGEHFILVRINNSKVSAGLQTAMYSFQNSPEYWAAADEFRPERFLPQRDGGGAGAAANPAFAPFGDVSHCRCADGYGRQLLQHGQWTSLSPLGCA